MAKKTCHQHPTFKNLIYNLHSLLTEQDALVEYLGALDSCPSCRTLVESLDRALDQLGHDAPLVASEIYDREAIYHELIDIVPAARRLAIEDGDESPLFRHWGVVCLLLENARKAKTLDEARELADLALFIVRRLDTELYLTIYIQNLLARVHATLALVELRAGRLAHARICIDLARATAELGIDDAHPDIDAAEAEVLMADGRTAEAEALRDGARERSEPDGETLSNVRQSLLERLTRYGCHYDGSA